MRALANDREITAMLGVPVRRVEAAPGSARGSCAASGLLLGNLVGLDIVGLTFLVIPALAAALIGQLRSLWVTLAAGLRDRDRAVGLPLPDVLSSLADYRTMTPFVLAIIALLWFVAGRRCVRTDSRDAPRSRRDRDDRPGRGAVRPAAVGQAGPAGWSSSGCLAVRPASGCRSARQLLDAGDDRGRDLQHRHARPRPADRPGRDGVAVPVRAAGGRARGWRCASVTRRRCRSRCWS